MSDTNTTKKPTGMSNLQAGAAIAIVGLVVVALILIFAPTTDTATVALIVTTLGTLVANAIGIVRVGQDQRDQRARDEEEK